MVMYRRNIIPGGRYFFTVTLLDRASRLLIERIAELRDAFRAVRAQRPYTMDAVVVLPDHLHCVVQLPEGDTDFTLRLRLIKSGFSKSLPRTEWLSAVRRRRGERGIWQRRFWEHLTPD